MASKKLKLHQWHVLNAKNNPETCVLFLPGRDHIGTHMGKVYKQFGLYDHLLVSITPIRREWYPMPNGIYDQEAAVMGLEQANQVINGVLDKIGDEYGVSRQNIILCGYSAGGVMAIYVATHSDECFAGVVSHSGAILEPDELPPCHCDTPFLLTHNRDDSIFEWYERYLPMKEALKQMGYTVFTQERPDGGHVIDEVDVTRAAHFMKACFKRIGY